VNRIGSLLRAAAIALLVCFCAFAPRAATQRAAAAEPACSGLETAGLVANTIVTSARTVAADAAPNIPAYCEVVATIRPVPGSNIGVVYRLPDDWNGKLLGIGGGGFAGDVTLAGAAQGLIRGYAVIETDTGHSSTNPTDGSFMIDAPGKINRVTLTDFGFRAVHEMTLAGKAIVAHYYGHGPSKSYFEGCSTGGRQGFTEVQRFPDDYDGVISGAPLYDLRAQTSALFRIQFFQKDPASKITPAQVQTINADVLRACDLNDGVRDGVIEDPANCKWDPAAIACKGGNDAGTGCLTARQVMAVRRSYNGIATQDGRVAAFPLPRGGELQWTPFSIGGTPTNPFGLNFPLGVQYFMDVIYANPNQAWDSITPEQALGAIGQSDTAPLVTANNPDVSAFFKRGGKWIMWHGLYDPAPSPQATLEYYHAALAASAKKMGVSEAALASDVRVFLAPGVYHCGGGPGPDQFDLLSALDDWAAGGKPPARILATKTASPLSRPLCVYPAQARFTGSGDSNRAENFICK
jgi:feruloyl esterase